MTMHQRSLDNLKLPKKKRKYGYRYALPQEKIDELFSLITDSMPLREAAKKIDICYDTAKKYFEHGDDRRGIRPLKLRLQIFQDSVSKEFDKDLIVRRKELITLVKQTIDQLKEAIEAKVLIKKGSFAQLSSMIHLEMWLRGGEVTRHEKRFISAEDIRDAADGPKEGD